MGKPAAVDPGVYGMRDCWADVAGREEVTIGNLFVSSPFAIGDYIFFDYLR